VFCFLEDHAGLEQQGFLHLIKNIKESHQRSFYWITEPHILIVKSKLFFEIGGYDERFGAYGNYDVEIRERLKNFGAIYLDFPVELVKPKHLRETLMVTMLWVFKSFRGASLVVLSLLEKAV